MAYPSSSQPKTELLINGTWTDISTRVRGESKITISRGRVNEQGRVTAQRANLSINNRDGLYSTRNPGSIYYGLLPRNTQIRVSAGTPSSSDIYAKLFATDDSVAGSYIATPDAAALDIVGDLDIRADVQPHSWRPTGFQVFISKWNNAAVQKSYIFYLGPDGTLRLSWSTTGASAGRVTVSSTVAVPTTSGRLSVRATLDVDNGAAGNTVTFYTATSITGTYTQLGTAVVTAGVTSIFASTSDLTIGGADDGSGFTDANPYGGRVYQAQVYSGIAGSLVANPDFTAQAIGATSFADSTGKTWTVTFGRITSDRIRFWGELSTLPQYWDRTGRDVYVPVTASGIIRRLTQGASPLRSPMYRNLIQYTPHGYWPFEDSFQATSAASAAPRSANAITTNVTFAADNRLPGTETAVQFSASTSKIKGSAASTAATNFATLVLYIKVDALPAAGTPGFASFWLTGSVVGRVDVGLSSTAWTFNYYATDGTTLLLNSNTAIGTINPAGQWVGFNILLTKSGGNVQASARWDVAGSDAGGVGPTVLAAGNVGYFSRFQLTAAGDTSFQTMRFAHLFFSTQNLDLTNSPFRQASNAYSGERAITRLRRLATEEGVSLEVSGYAVDSETMGYQATATFMDLAYDCQDADQGILAESRDSLALFYRSRVDMENRHDLTLSERLFHLSEIPVAPEDDTGIVNDVTVTRATGSSARATVDTGPLSTLAPPNGVGRYDTSVDVNALDTRLADIAQWKAFLGTWDEPRFPTLSIGLHRAPFVTSASLTLSAFQLDLGDTTTLTGLPSWMPPDDILLLTQGYTEVLWKLTWDITFNTTPAGPYRLPVASSDDFIPRADAASTVLNAAVTSTATSIGLKTSTGALWVTTAVNPTEFPFNIKVAGEVMTVTAITGTTSPQTATVTRSANGIIKAQSINAPIYLVQPAYVSL